MDREKKKNFHKAKFHCRIRGINYCSRWWWWITGDGVIGYFQPRNIHQYHQYHHIICIPQKQPAGATNLFISCDLRQFYHFVYHSHRHHRHPGQMGVPWHGCAICQNVLDYNLKVQMFSSSAKSSAPPLWHPEEELYLAQGNSMVRCMVAKLWLGNMTKRNEEKKEANERTNKMYSEAQTMRNKG